MAIIPSPSGQSQLPPFYSIVTSESLFKLADLEERIRKSAQEAADKSRNKSPGAKAVEAAGSFEISVLTLWQE